MLLLGIQWESEFDLLLQCCVICVTSSDISTVLHGAQGPWAVTPLSGWSSLGPLPVHSKEAILLPFGFPL